MKGAIVGVVAGHVAGHGNLGHDGADSSRLPPGSLLTRGSFNRLVRVYFVRVSPIDLIVVRIVGLADLPA
jgi:hypothetical protein